MRRLAALLLLALPAGAAAETLPAGAWDVTSKVVDLSIPGVPGFIQRMVRGKSKAERKRLLPGEGIEALLAPDPKAKCQVDGQHVADGRYTQTLRCPQKQGEPLRIVRAGIYNGAGFTGRATVSGTTPKGALNIVLDQNATRVGG